MINTLTPVYNNIVCYYINLERRKDRLELIDPDINYLSKWMHCERFNAVDAKTLKIQTYVNNKVLVPNPCFEKKYKFKTGHLACLLSHLNCWKKFFNETEYNYLLVLEDDIIINKNYFESMFSQIMDKIDNLDFDWLYLGRQSLGYQGFYYTNSAVVENIFYQPKYPGSGNHSYIISRNGADNLIKYLNSPKKIGNNSYQIPCWPLDRWDVHSRFYKNAMGKDLKLYSIIPEDWASKSKIHRAKHLQTNSTDFLFYPRCFSDSDTFNSL